MFLYEINIRKRGTIMKHLIKQVFEMAAEQGAFDKIDTMLDSRCEALLAPYKEWLKEAGYEQLRDVVYAISYYSKKSAFELGFKTAINFLMECMQDEETT